MTAEQYQCYFHQDRKWKWILDTEGTGMQKINWLEKMMAINSSHALRRGFNLWKEAYLDCKIFYTDPGKWKCLTTPCVDLPSCFHSPLHSLKPLWIEECRSLVQDVYTECGTAKCFTVSECLVYSLSLQQIVAKLSAFSLTSSTFTFSWSLLQIRAVFLSLTTALKL